MNTPTILREVARGKDLSPDEFCFFLSERNHHKKILRCANEMNLERNGDRVTFVYNRNINYTNVCVNRCGFCGFRRDIKDKGSYILTVKEILSKLAETPDVSEVCIQGGLHPKLDFSYILDMLREIKAKFPNIHIHAFSPMEIYYFSQKSGKSISSTLESLIDCGLDSLPGTAAEILDETIRKVICPGKVTVKTWIKIVKTAHRLGLKSTATILFGHLETPRQMAQHIETIRTIQYETRGFTEFVPLPFVPLSTPLGKMLSAKEMIPFDRIRLIHALFRIYFGNSIHNIQSSWPKLGLDRALSLTFSGVNDLGGTLHEEHITKSAGGNHGEKVSIQEFREKITNAGKIPQLRTTLYEFY